MEKEEMEKKRKEEMEKKRGIRRRRGGRRYSDQCKKQKKPQVVHPSSPPLELHQLKYVNVSSIIYSFIFSLR